MEKNLCPCGSALPLAQCCQPIFSGKKTAATAEALLRARYSAFALHEIDFILSSHHSKTRGEIKRDEVEDWSNNSTWHGLKIIQKEAGESGDQQGTIVFCAEYQAKNAEADSKNDEHWEQALFEKEAEEWKFLDARGIRQGTYVREEPKMGRNDPCKCGSGKKFKKCHGVTGTVF